MENGKYVVQSASLLYGFFSSAAGSPLATSTLVPSAREKLPSITTVSPPCKPEVISILSLVRIPTVTFVSWATNAASTTITVPSFALLASSVTAEVGTTTASAFELAEIVTCAAPLARNLPAPFDNATQTSTVRLVGSDERPSNVIRPFISSLEVSVGRTVAGSPTLSSDTTVSAKGALMITSLTSAMVTSFPPAAANSPWY